MIAAAAIAAYVALCILQVYEIQSNVGLTVSLWDVIKYTLSLFASGKVWLPFLQQPPRQAT